MMTPDRPSGRAQQAPAGTRGFDANTVITDAAAVAFKKAGYRFAVRYVRRTQARSNDLSKNEIVALHRSGLAVSVVQHVESDKLWNPTTEKGHSYGRTAATACTELGIPAGVTVWLDLEGVNPEAEQGATDTYCRLWFDQVKSTGYQPGLYVGWHAGLSAQQLYLLPFTRYWSAYNLNVDQRPAKVGVCMKQREAKPGDVPRGLSIEIDTDLVTGDLRSRLPTMFAPDEWDVPA